MGGLYVSICDVEFEDDATPEHANMLLNATASFAELRTDACIMKTDHSSVSFLRALLNRFDSTDLAESQSGQSASRSHDGQFGMPAFLRVASQVAERLQPDDEAACDQEAAFLLLRLAKSLGNRIDFLGTPDGIVSGGLQARLSQLDALDGWAAFWAVIHGSRIVQFVAFEKESDKVSELWLKQCKLLPVADAVYRVFFSVSQLLEREYANPKNALDFRVAMFLKLTLTSWFALARNEPDAWCRWATRLRVDEEMVYQELAPALDMLLHTLLCMDGVLDDAFKKSSLGGGIADLIKKVVPSALLGRLPSTSDRLSLQSNTNAAPKCGKTKSLTLSGVGGSVSMRPSWAQKKDDSQ